MKSLLAAAALTIALAAPAFAMTEAECAAKIDQVEKAISPAGGGTGGVEGTKAKEQLELARNSLANKDMTGCENATNAAEGALMGK